jgi:hypothetical protein
MLAQRGNLQAETVTAEEERTAIGDHRENERYHHRTSYPLLKPGDAPSLAGSVAGSSFDEPQPCAPAMANNKSPVADGREPGGPQRIGYGSGRRLASTVLPLSEQWFASGPQNKNFNAI